MVLCFFKDELSKEIREMIQTFEEKLAKENQANKRSELIMVI